MKKLILHITISVYLSDSTDADVKQNHFRLQFSPYGHIMFRERIMARRHFTSLD